MKYVYLPCALMMVAASALADSSTSIMSNDNSDNTRRNEVDRSSESVTADQQKNNVSDQKITQMIRQEIVADHEMSTYGHNVKIITRDGRVVLRGPVRSAEERDKIVQSATRVAGAGNVTNHLQIAHK